MRGAIPLRLVRPDGEPRATGAERHPRPPHRWWPRWRGEDQSMRALAALDDDEVCHLSEMGQRLRQYARWQRRSRC